MNLSHTPRHLSASSISQYLFCPADFYWNRVEGITRPPSVALRFGSSVHLGLRAHHLGRDPFDAFTEAWWHSEEELRAIGITASGQYTDWGIALLKLYRRDPLQGGQSEVRWDVNVPDLAVPLVGYYDLTDDGWIGEFKTGAWPWKEGRAQEEYQGALYAAVYELVTGKPLERLTYRILTCQPDVAMKEETLLPDPERDTRTFEIARVVLRSLEAGIWTPRCAPANCRYPGESYCPLLRAVATRDAGVEPHSVDSDSVGVGSV